MLLLPALATGCAAVAKVAPPPPAGRTSATSEAGTRAPEVQQALMVFVDQFIPALAEGCDYIVRHSKSPDAKMAAQARKVGGALAAMKNAANPRPYAGLLDMVVMVTLLSDVVDTPDAKNFYGPEGQRLTAILLAQKKEIWRLASQFVTEAQLQELRDSIKVFQDAPPQRQYVAFVRIGQIPETRQIQDSKQSRPNSVFGLLFLDPLSNLDPAVREFEMSRQLAERAFFYLQRMPIIISWQTEALYTQMLAAPEMQQATKDVSAVAGSTTRFTDASAQFAGTIEHFRGDIPQLRDDSVQRIEQAVQRQRESAIKQATTQVSAERDAAIRQLAASVRTEQHEWSGNMHQVLTAAIDHLFWRAAALIGLVLASACIYRLIFRRLPVRVMSDESIPEISRRN